MGKNSIIHAGTLIAGKTTIGENCTFGFKSSAINKINIVDNVNVGAFSNITKDITKSGKYVGTIARYVGE
jgi:UDP-3-O-[3-hydroxymyristoyl] glucosamine N-acyltransferase